MLFQTRIRLTFLALFFSLSTFAQKTFDYEKNRENLINKSIDGLSEEFDIQNWTFEFRSHLKRGWLNINMNEHNITTNKPFYVAFQWTSNNTLFPTIGMSGKKGVNRASSFDEWKDSGEFRWMMNAEVTYFDLL